MLFILFELMKLDKTLFDFEILDYDTHSGIDMLVKPFNVGLVDEDKYFYVELKCQLGHKYNHTFKNTHKLICWETNLNHDDIIQDLSSDKWKLEVDEPSEENEITKYYIKNRDSSYRVELIILKRLLKEKLDIVVE